MTRHDPSRLNDHASRAATVSKPVRATAFDLTLLAGAILVVLLLVAPVSTIPLHIPINYNEGWDAGLDTRAINPSAGPLYPGPGSWVFNNYPPLGFFIVGAAGRWIFGDMIIAGRTLSLLSLLAAAALAGYCTRKLGASTRAAIASAILILLFACSYYRSYVAMDDPQWMAHATMLAGLAMLLRRHGTTGLRTGETPTLQIMAAALLMTTGGFIKHNLVALPLATTLFLLWLNPRAARAWCASAITALILGAGAMQARFGNAAFQDILHHRRIFRPILYRQAIPGLAPLLAAAIFVAANLRRRTGGDATIFATLFILIATITGIIQRMGEGVYFNAHFETIIALCIATGLALTPLSETPLQWRLKKPAYLAKLRFGPAAAAIFAASPVLGAMPFHLPKLWHDFATRHEIEAAWQPMIDRIHAANGPAACEMNSLCYWAGKPLTVDFFNITQNAIAGGEREPFRNAAQNHGFAIIEDDPALFLHKYALRKLGYDPIMLPFTTTYTKVFEGPKGKILLAPRQG